MMQGLTIARLEGFFHVAKTGGYARAAKAFPYPITQPAVHQQVRKLEAEVGAKLFSRAAKDRMALTAEGRVLYDFVKPFFEGLPGVVSALRHKSFGGTVTMHASGLLVRKLLPGWLHRLGRVRPDVTVDLHESEEPAIALLRSGGTDLVVDHLPAVPPDIATKRIGSAYGFLVLPSNHPATRRRRWSLSDLADDSFISYPPGSAAFHLQMDFLARHAIAPPRMLSAGSADAILGFVEAAVGWSLIPWLDPNGPRSPELLVKPIAEPRGGFAIHVAFRRRDEGHPLLEAVLGAATPPADRAPARGARGETPPAPARS